MEREFPETAPVCKAANALVRAGRAGDARVAPPNGIDAALVGSAVEFVLPITHRAARKPLVLPAPTRELAYARMLAAKLALEELERIGNAGTALEGAALERAADCALVCARLEQRFRMGERRAIELALPDPAVGTIRGLDGAIQATRASAETRADLVAVLAAGLVDTADLYEADPLAINPVFALSGAVGGADADVISDGLLIDFKTGKGRSLISTIEIYQLIGYVLLDVDDSHRIRSIGIHALRWRSRWVIDLKELLCELSCQTRTLPDWRSMFASVLEGDQQIIEIGP